MFMEIYHAPSTTPTHQASPGKLENSNIQCATQFSFSSVRSVDSVSSVPLCHERYKICGKILYSFDGQNIVDCGYSFGDNQKVPRTLSAIQHPQEMMEERQIQRS